MSKSTQHSGGRHRRAVQTRHSAARSPHNRLQVVHRRHTGRLLPHSATSYPMLGMIVLCMGVIMSGWTHIVSGLTLTGGGSYTVTASVPGKPPTIPAVIVIPVANTRFTTKPVTVSGTCQYNINGAYVSVYRNNTYGGSAICDTSGNFSVPSDLFDGANVLVVRTFNFGAVAGPDSAPVTVFYDPPVAPVTPSSSTTPNSSGTKPATGFSSNSGTPTVGAAPNSAPLVITSDFSIKGYSVDQQTEWQLDLTGGSAPYAIATDWGDGSHGIISQTNPGTISMTHVFSEPGDYKGIYVVKITATDADGRQSYLQLLVVINAKDKSLVSGIGSSDITGTDYSGRTLQALGKYAWPTYGVTALMLASFWLGEHHILQAAGKHIIKRPRRI